MVSFAFVRVRSRSFTFCSRLFGIRSRSFTFHSRVVRVCSRFVHVSFAFVLVSFALRSRSFATAWAEAVAASAVAWRGGFGGGVARRWQHWRHATAVAWRGSGGAIGSGGDVVARRRWHHRAAAWPSAGAARGVEARRWRRGAAAAAAAAWASMAVWRERERARLTPEIRRRRLVKTTGTKALFPLFPNSFLNRLGLRTGTKDNNNAYLISLHIGYLKE
ncbi:hypothetical protein [Oryza sativa Japonica Group]|uniref:Uncharacterized protein n=1 Tax=Oryza sativa subsp. japonica TaxID=39947 RepID=Q5JKA9_ORYSJ|nr:hypothetical protein [Oryza sativa Japonica Group]